MRQLRIVSSILVALYATLTVAGAEAQNAQDPTATPSGEQKQNEQLQTITVTGSLIPRAQVETASPVITISAQDLETHGFRNVYDALHTMPVATGSVQDSQVASQGSFTAGATTISLFGLDPGFTLILLNGHPLADYPLPYNGNQNITDLSTIPMEAVDHIDILSGGQSSLYGSSAIAGVVNIVLKKKIEGLNLAVRGGGYSNGGGGNERVQLSGGAESGNLSASYSLSFENQDPVRFHSTPFGTRADNPLGGNIAGRDFLELEPFTGKYFDPGSATCAALHNLFGGTIDYSHRSGGRNYCGSTHDYDNATLLNANKSANGYLNLGYRLTSNMELYGEVLAGVSKQKVNSGPSFWGYFNPQLVQSANGFSGDFWDNARQDFASIQRFFSPEEMGGADVADENIHTRQYSANIGLRGAFGSSDWNYDAYYNRSQVNTRDSQLWPLTQPFNDYYLGAQQGTDPGNPSYNIPTYGFPAYTPNLANFYKPLTPAQFRAMTAPIKSSSVSWEQNVHVTLTNTDLFQLPAGPVGVAAIAEAGNQAFNNPVDPREIAGDFNNRTGTQGSGTRKRYAIGGELTIPLLSKLTADVSARFDSYDFAGRTDSKPTYKLGLEYRPIDTLLLRGNYATAFRAPDMLYVFQGNSGYYTSANDYYLCRQQGYNQDNLGSCPNAGQGIFSFYHGSPDLKDITAKTYGLGTVWSPTSNFDVKVDYTHIQIDNEVQSQTPDNLLALEANCRLGTSFGGQAFDINSALCQSAIAQVVRYPSDYSFLLAQGQIKYVLTFPQNIANEHLSGIQANSTYRMDLGRYGNLALSAQYYVELKHKQQLHPGDPYIDLLHNFNSYEFKSRSSASVSWAIDNWTTTLYGTLYGRGVNYSGTAGTGQWSQFNGSVQYDFNEKASALFTVNNIGNRAPPSDIMSATPGNQLPPPYYNAYVYNGFGRIYWLEYKFHF